MGFATVVGTLSFLFAGTWRHSSFRSTECTTLCLEASPESSNNHQQQQPLSVWNRTVAKYGLEKAKEIRKKSGQAHTEKYGSAFNATAQKYGLERAKEIYSDNARKQMEMYGTAWDRTKSKHGLKKAKAMRREIAGKQMEKYGSIFNAMVAKYGVENALEINRGSLRKAKEALMEKYTYEEIQQMGLRYGVEGARNRGFRTRYPGVTFQKQRAKWRVKFSHKGKIHLAGAAHATERAAALAHDDYVRNLGLNRPLHFPREGERTSYVDDGDPS